MQTINNEAEYENTLYSLALLRGINNQVLLNAFLEAKRELRLEEQASWNKA